MRSILEPAGVMWIPASTTGAVARAALADPVPDLFHAHMTAAELAGVVAGTLRRRPVLATAHFAQGRGHSGLTRLVYRSIAARLDAQIAVSRYVGASAGGDLPVVPLGIPAPVRPTVDHDRPPVVLLAQRLEAEKQTDVAVRAWAASRLGEQGWELHVAGRGSAESDVRALAEELDPEHVRFLGEIDVPEALTRSSMLLAPCPDEAFGLTVVEAMAAGVPVVAAAAGGHLETVGPVSPETLFAPGDHQAAAAVLDRLAADPDERVHLADAGRTRFDRELRIERHVDHLVEIYENLHTVSRPRPATRVADAATGVAPSIALVFPACHREGGVERVVRELARHSAVSRRVTFVGDRFDPTGMDGVAFVPTATTGSGGLGGRFGFRARARRALADLDVDVVVGFGAECPTPDVAVVGSVHRAWLAHRGAITTPVGRLPGSARRLLLRHQILLALERSYFAGPRLQLALATSPATACELTEHYRIPASHVEVLPNGFDPDEFHRGVRAEHREQQRDALALDDEVVLLFVGNELHRKGFGTLVEAVARVDDRRMRVELVGRADPAPYARRIDALRLTGRIRWNGPQAEMAPWYAAADLLVLPTTYEPFGNVIVEALACGLPVITSEAAGAAAAVEPDVTGLLLRRPSDADELARLLQHALEDDTIARWSMATGTDLDDYEWANVAARFTSAVDRLARLVD
jgi:glycosyltransferase involved in cell wall biosynthesis